MRAHLPLRLVVIAVLALGCAGGARADSHKHGKASKPGKNDKNDKNDKSDKPADKPPDATDPVAETQAQQLLDKGIEVFKKNQLDEAYTAFNKVRELVPTKANPYRWLGLVEARMNRCKEAVEHLDVFIGRVPAGDPRTVEAITVRDRCREDLSPKYGTLVVDSTPTGADLRLDRDESPVLGTTPFTSAQVEIGSHVVLLKKEGFQPLSKVFTLAKGDTARLDLALIPERVAQEEGGSGSSPGAAAPPKKSKLWVLGLVAGVVGAGVVGVGLGVGLSKSAPSEAAFPSVQGF